MEKIQGIIVKAIDGFYYVFDQKIEYVCKSRKKFRFNDIKPKVGDRVEISLVNYDRKEGVIEKIFDRTSSLIRPSVSNVTQVFLVFSYIEPKINFETLNKLLVNFEAECIKSIVIISKSDLYSKEDFKNIESIFLNFPYEVIFLSSSKDLNMDKVKLKIKDNISCFCGPSGVGKSSILNSIVKEDIMDVSDISHKIKRGKHTTRFSKLIYVSDLEGYIVDTPGFTSVDIKNNITKSTLKKYFIEFDGYSDCKFRECMHINEIGCNVKKALDDGLINKIRYEQYISLYNKFDEKRR